MKRVILGAAVLYLVLGLVVTNAIRPQQMWTCPDESQPHGTITYGDLDEAPSDDCLPSVSNAERLQWIAVATPVWLPLLLAQGLSSD